MFKVGTVVYNNDLRGGPLSQLLHNMYYLATFIMRLYDKSHIWSIIITLTQPTVICFFIVFKIRFRHERPINLIPYINHYLTYNENTHYKRPESKEHARMRTPCYVLWNKQFYFSTSHKYILISKMT